MVVPLFGEEERFPFLHGLNSPLSDADAYGLGRFTISDGTVPVTTATDLETLGANPYLNDVTLVLRISVPVREYR